MHITIPPTDTQRNVEAIKHAIDRKMIECDQASKKLDDLRAELRGLKAALDVINPRTE